MFLRKFLLLRYYCWDYTKFTSVSIPWVPVAPSTSVKYIFSLAVLLAVTVTFVAREAVPVKSPVTLPTTLPVTLPERLPLNVPVDKTLLLGL